MKSNNNIVKILLQSKIEDPAFYDSDSNTYNVEEAHVFGNRSNAIDYVIYKLKRMLDRNGYLEYEIKPEDDNGKITIAASNIINDIWIIISISKDYRDFATFYKRTYDRLLKVFGNNNGF